MTTILEAERLVLRPLRPGDVEALVSFWTDPEVTRFMGGPRDAATLRPSLEERAASGVVEENALWPTVEKSTGAVVGHCGLLAKEIEGRDEIEIVYVLARSAWGRGYATEVARGLVGLARRRGIGRLVALIDPANVASERVALKLGMRAEKDVVRPGGTIRRLYVLEG